MKFTSDAMRPAPDAGRAITAEPAAPRALRTADPARTLGTRGLSCLPGRHTSGAWRGDGGTFTLRSLTAEYARSPFRAYRPC